MNNLAGGAYNAVGAVNMDSVSTGVFNNAGTFNKIMFPSLRIGYLVVPDELVDVFLSIRSWSDGCPPGVIQSRVRGSLLRPSSWGTCPERPRHSIDSASGEPAPATC